MSNPRDRSLFTVIEEVLGPLPGQDQQKTDRISRGSNALSNWYRIVYVLSKVSCHPSKELLWNTMSIWHRRSFRMLFDWWTASYQDPECSLASILALIDRCEEVECHGWRQKENEDRVEVIVLKLLELKRWPEGDIWTPSKLPAYGAGLTGYHDQLEILFLAEFDTINDSGGQRQNAFWEQRRRARSSAAQSAFCQQMAWQLLERHQEVEWFESGSAKDFEATFGVEEHKETDLTMTGPVIEACPWLPPVADDGLPYYLWDVANAKTVETSQIQCYPEYTAISHTWGRWATGQAIDVKGVNGWKIPQNTRFRVEEIPEILRNVPSKTQYIWLDLCCIPQDPGSVIGAQEIARQAQIFRKARVVVAWFNEVDDFQALGDVLQWKALQLLHLPLDITGGSFAAGYVVER